MHTHVRTHESLCARVFPYTHAYSCTHTHTQRLCLRLLPGTHAYIAYAYTRSFIGTNVDPHSLSGLLRIFFRDLKTAQ